MTDPHGIDVAALAAEIAARLRALPNRTVPIVRRVRREFSQRLAHAPAQAVLTLALHLLDHPDFESRFVAYELVSNHRAALRSLHAQELEQLGRGMDDWGAVDAFACYLAGPAWREHQVADSVVHAWAHSPDRWWRRAALVSSVALNNQARGGRGDTTRTLAVCHMLVHDADDMVVKALSWALRELAKRDPQAVSAFLTKHEAALAARVVREVRNKLTTGRKNPRRV